MSPEQLQGKEVDARSDLFSFGCVLYEMLTGKRAFEGQSPASVIAAILEREPAPLEVARPLDRVIRRSLAKDPDQRFHTARDLKAALSWALEQPTASDDASNEDQAAVGRCGGGAGGYLDWTWRGGLARDTASGPPADAAERRSRAGRGRRSIHHYRNFTRWIAAGISRQESGRQTNARHATAGQSKPALLSGTENGRDPFFSPDGKWIGFFADGKMKKISVQGGVPVVLCDAPLARGASWGTDGNIVAALNIRGPLSRVPAEGGMPQPVTKQGALSYHWPQALPGSEAVLVTISPSIVAFENASIGAVSLKTGEIKILVRGGYFGRYLPTGDSTGHLVYVHEGVLFGVPFDPTRLEVRGAAVPMLEDLAADPSSGAGQFSFAGTGTFVYRTGKASAQSWPYHGWTNPGRPSQSSQRQAYT